MVDMWLTQEGFWQNYGSIDTYQGNTTTGANNRFSHTNTGTVIKGDFYDENHSANTFQYYFNTEISQKTTPFYFSASLALNVLPLDNGSMCPYSLLKGRGFSDTPGLVFKNRAQIEELKSKFDGANTAGLLQDINTNKSFSDLKYNLVGASPYLSDTVLTSYFLKANVPVADILEIYDLNKPVIPKVWKVLINKDLDSETLSKLTKQQNSVTTSPRIVLETDIATLNHQKGLVIDEQIRLMLQDTINGYNADDIAKVLSVDDRPNAKQRTLSAYIANGNLDKAAGILADIKSQTGGNLDDFTNFQQIMLNLRKSPENIYALKTNLAVQSIVNKIAANKYNNDAYINAVALLKIVNGYKYNEYVKLLYYNDGRNITQGRNLENSIEVLKNMVIYPNPTNGNVYVKYTLPEKYNKAEVRVLDVLGKEVLKHILLKGTQKTLLNTRSLKGGIYFVNFVIDGNLSETQKLIMQ
jgi:hypothetical protein